MFVSLLSFCVPIFLSAYASIAYFSDFYPLLSSVNIIFALLSSAVCLFLIIPVKPVIRPLCSAIGFIFLIVATHNIFFTFFTVAFAVILSFFATKSGKKQHIIFYDDSRFLYVTHKKKRSFKRVYKSFCIILMLVLSLLFSMTFIFRTPFLFWNIRAFPIDTAPKSVYGTLAVPSGEITCSISYDLSAILVDSCCVIPNDGNIAESPAAKAGIKKGDIITKINSQRAKDSDFITKGIFDKSLDVTILRPDENGELNELIFNVTPIYSIPEGKYLMGITYYPNISAGIYSTTQTVSFTYPPDSAFAATAHSTENSCADYTHILKSAQVTGRDDGGIVATPIETIGRILATDLYGAFGVWENTTGDLMPIAKKDELRLGRATLLSDFEGGDVTEYEVYVTGTYRIDERDVIALIVPDKRIRNTGGITKGMSGSPIIQNGKIIGALSNTDNGGYCAYATFAYDMAHQMYLHKETLKEAFQ